MIIIANIFNHDGEKYRHFLETAESVALIEQESVSVISFNDLHDRVVVIDAYNVLHQFLAGIRQRDGTLLKNSRGEITSHLSGLFPCFEERKR